MIVAFDVGWDRAFIDKMEDCCTDFRHGDDAWSHGDKPAGGVGQYLVLAVACVIDACGDLVAEEHVA